jgi:hypothetical protein
MFIKCELVKTEDPSGLWFVFSGLVHPVVIFACYNLNEIRYVEGSRACAID